MVGMGWGSTTPARILKCCKSWVEEQVVLVVNSTRLWACVDDANTLMVVDQDNIRVQLFD